MFDNECTQTLLTLVNNACLLTSFHNVKWRDSESETRGVIGIEPVTFDEGYLWIANEI